MKGEPPVQATAGFAFAAEGGQAAVSGMAVG
jgi:hypothetical protein